ncbi:MAG TPA: hypothetical protein VIM37_01730 [Candidatus Microsaccharimonas sp.]|jgi:hypothetical protein
MTKHIKGPSLTPHRSDSNLIRIVQVDSSGAHKLFSVKFHFDKKERLQIFIQPYVINTNGMITKCIQPPGKSSVSLESNGKVSSKNVKYSHGLDGMAHFSGSIFSVMRNQARRLDGRDTSQLFSITINDYSNFKSIDPALVETNEYIKIKTSQADKGKTLRISAWWYSGSSVLIKEDIGPGFVYEKDGIKRNAIALAPTIKDWHNILSQHFLLLDFTFEDTPNEPASYALMGGFDCDRNADKDFTFLVQTYPAYNFEKLKETLGDIDYQPGRTPPLITSNRG